MMRKRSARFDEPMWPRSSSTYHETALTRSKQVSAVVTSVSAKRDSNAKKLADVEAMVDGWNMLPFSGRKKGSATSKPSARPCSATLYCMMIVKQPRESPGRTVIE
jgi:hypothetical protein